MKSLVVNSVVRRLAGEQQSRPRAFFTASAVAAGAGVVVYKLLRSGSEEDDSET